jgi:hypothetical protein
VGEVRGGQRQGKGVLEFSNGCVYCGYFKDDVPNGEGAYYFPNGESYEGKLTHITTLMDQFMRVNGKIMLEMDMAS